MSSRIGRDDRKHFTGHVDLGHFARIEPERVQLAGALAADRYGDWLHPEMVAQDAKVAQTDGAGSLDEHGAGAR
jgi:hypothetical protein